MSGRPSYFSRLYRHNRPLAVVVFAFFGPTLLANAAGIELTPFFVWGMYSEREADPGIYRIPRVVLNDTIPVDYTAGKPKDERAFLCAPVAEYLERRAHPGERLQHFLDRSGPLAKLFAPVARRLYDSALTARFPAWYRSYAGHALGIPAGPSDIREVAGRFDSAGFFQPVTEYPHGE